MEAFMDNLTGLVAVVFALGIPVITIVMVFVTAMQKRAKDKEIRQLIIENHTDPETAKLLIDEPKKQPRKIGQFDLGTLRTACMLLGIGLGACINWLTCVETKSIYFWLIIACGVGIGLLCSFLVEMHLYKKYGRSTNNDTTTADIQQQKQETIAPAE